MRPGQSVVYESKTGARCAASVVAIVGTGPSGFKVLNLAYERGGKHYAVPGVLYVADRAKGGDCWALTVNELPTRTRGKMT